MAKELLTLLLADILPSSISSDTQVTAASQALDPELQSVSRDIREALILSRIDELPEEVIDLLAWQWHVDFYDLARTREMKIAMVKGSIAWHRKKGTRWAILKALEMLGIDGVFTPWWEISGAKPYTFAINASIPQGYWTRGNNVVGVTHTIRQAIETSKAARSWLSSLDVHVDMEAQGRVYLGIATVQGGERKLRPPAPKFNPAENALGIAAVHSGSIKIPIRPPSLPDCRLAFAGVTALSGKIKINAGKRKKQEGE